MSTRSLERPPKIAPIRAVEPVTIPKDFSLWRMSIGKYHELVAAAVLDEDDPVELLEGWLVQKMPKNPPHVLATRLLEKALEKIIPAAYFVRAQEPITLADSEPEPDIVVVQGDFRDFSLRHPSANEVGMVAEIANATLGRDRGSKQRIYARAGIPIYWVVNLVDRCIEVYTLPIGLGANAGYQQHQVYGLNEFVPVVIADYLLGQLPVQDLLPEVES
jgi:hypothetical protein